MCCDPEKRSRDYVVIGVHAIGDGTWPSQNSDAGRSAQVDGSSDLLAELCSLSVPGQPQSANHSSPSRISSDKRMRKSIACLVYMDELLGVLAIVDWNHLYCITHCGIILGGEGSVEGWHAVDCGDGETTGRRLEGGTKATL